MVSLLARSYADHLPIWEMVIGEVVNAREWPIVKRKVETRYK
jgi:hypothetical protein